MSKLVQDVETVTPAMAYDWLQTANENNRPLSNDVVRRYALDMSDNAWRLNGQPIQFDVNGQLINGQHRLMACVEAGVSFRTAVVRGVEKDAWKTIDKLRPRKVGDTLRQTGQKYGNQIAAWFNTGRRLLVNHTVSPTDHGVEEFQNTYTGALVWALDHVRPGDAFSIAAVLGAFVFAHPTNPKAVEELWTQATTGVNLTPGSPALALRNYVMTYTRKHAEAPRVRAMKVLRCVYAHIRGEILHETRLLVHEGALDYFKKAHGSNSPLRTELVSHGRKRTAPTR